MLYLFFLLILHCLTCLFLSTTRTFGRENIINRQPKRVLKLTFPGVHYLFMSVNVYKRHLLLPFTKNFLYICPNLSASVETRSTFVLCMSCQRMCLLPPLKPELLISVNNISHQAHTSLLCTHTHMLSHDTSRHTCSHRLHANTARIKLLI